MYFIDGYVGVMYIFWVFSKRKQTNKKKNKKNKTRGNVKLTNRSSFSLGTCLMGP